MILVIDNYDSFTYNLVQIVGSAVQDVRVRRNDEMSLDDVGRLGPKGIIISPGPGRPDDAGISVGLIERFGPRIPILGVCLGHQAIGVAYGGTIVHAPTLMHGRTSSIVHKGTPLFKGVQNPFVATRYHSLVISPGSLPDVLEVTAETSDGVIMGVRHRVHPVEGVQFHPESILTRQGALIVRNWLEVQKCL